MSNLLRYLCSMRDHPKASMFLDESGEFVVINCDRCNTILITSLVLEHQKEDYEAVLNRWVVDWKHDA